MPWDYDDAFRRVHIMFVSPEWARERGNHFDADRMISSLQAAHVNCIQLYAKDHFGYCYYKATKGIPFHLDLVAEVLPKAHAAGMKVLAYFSVGFDEYALGRHREWQAVDQRGQVRRFRNLFSWACLNTPYRDFALHQVEEIAAQYEVDGFWIDILPIVVDGNTIGWNWPIDLAHQAAQYPVPCYCPSCREKFRGRFGRDIPVNPTEEDRIVSYQFLLDTAADFMRDFRQVVYKHLPQALIMYNAGGAPEDAIDDSDVNCAEGLAPAYSFQSFSCRWAMSHGKPYEIITSSGLPKSVQSTWSVPQAVLFDHWTQKPAELLQLETSIAAAHGSNATLGFAPFPSGRVEQGEYAGYEAAFGRIAKMEPYLKKVEKVADVLLLLTIKTYDAPHRWADAMKGAESLHNALVQGHLQFDVAEERLVKDLTRYPVVVLADQLTMSGEEVERIRDYVRQGGNLIVTGATSLYDAQGRMCEDFQLADVMGVRYEGKIEEHFVYMRLRGSPLATGIPDVPILINRTPFSLSIDGGEVLGWLARPEALRTEATTIIWSNPTPDDRQLHPLILLHRYGKGRCLTVGVPLDTMGVANTWLRQLAINLVDLLLGQRSLTTNAPPGVEVVWNRQGRRSILHLINYQAGDADRLSTQRGRLVLQGIKVCLSEGKLGPFDQIRTLDPEAEVEHRSRDGWVEIDIPPFCVHTALVIERRS